MPTAKKTNGAAPPSEVAAIKAFIAEQERLEQGLDAAERAVSKAEQAFAEARRELADEQAGILMDDPTAELSPNGTEASARFLKALGAYEAATAAESSLRRKQKERDDALFETIEKLKSERETYNSSAVAEWLRDEYRPAKQAFAAVLRNGRALAASLGLDDLSPDDDGLGAALLAVPPCGEWQKDEQAMALHQQHCELHDLAGKLAEFRKGASYRRHISAREKRARVDAPFDANGQYRVRLPIRYFGKDYPAGSIVNTRSVDIATLAKLHSARQIMLEDSNRDD